MLYVAFGPRTSALALSYCFVGATPKRSGPDLPSEPRPRGDDALAGIAASTRRRPASPFR